MYLIDTNIISYSVYHPENYPLLIRNIRATRPVDRWVSVVTAHELIAFKYEAVQNTKNMPRNLLLRTYHDLYQVLMLVSGLQVKPFTADVYEHSLGMPGDVKIRDRRIAATALFNNFTVVTHDRTDFEAIRAVRPELRIEDWVDEDYTARRA